MKVTVYRTEGKDKRLYNEGVFEMPYINTDAIEEQGHPGDIEPYLVNIHDDVERQTVGGIGGAFTDSAATAWQRMPKDKQDELIKAYFDKQHGIGYNFGRLSIASCDFSTEDYTYVKEGDETLESFNVSHDKKAVFPMVYAAEKYADLKLFASPWSPPAYMKTNGNRIGGHLKKEYYPLWAKYFKKYLEACKENEIDVFAVTMQNEPRHHQIWESCLYTPEEESEFLGYLGAELDGTGVAIVGYDHCRERVFERAKTLAGGKNGKYFGGIAHHWYSGDHFGELRAFYERYPDKLNIASEGCCAVTGSGIQPERDLEFAEVYAHDICGCFNSGVQYYCDWNLTLDENNGPYHNREGRGCSADAPIFCNAATGELVYRLSYYYIGHYSKFVSRGAKVVGVSAYTDKLDCVAFKNPNGSVALVVLNRTDKSQNCIARLDGHIHKTSLAPHSIVTLFIEK